MRVLLTLALLLFASIVSAEDITLSWTPPTQNEDGTALTDLDGYRVYQSQTQGGPYTQIADIEETTASYIVQALTSGTYYFVTTAYNASGVESQYSNEATHTVVSVPNPPGNLTVQVDNSVAYLLSISDDTIIPVPVGFVDAGVQCDPSTSFNNLNRVDIEDVHYVGTVRPPVVFAECGG